MEIYDFSGPLIRIETYNTREMIMPHGYLAFFDSKGIIDFSGYTFNGRKEKSWYYYSDSLTVWQSEKYDNGILLKRMNEDELKAQREDLKNHQDTTMFQSVKKSKF